MTPERDAAVLAVQARLERAVASMPTPDLDAGWAALVGQLDGPIAPVLPLRRPPRGRAVALAVAAAMMITGAAFATVANFGDPGTAHVAPPPSPARVPVSGPHSHVAIGGPPSVVETPDHSVTGDHSQPADGQSSTTSDAGSVDGSVDGQGSGSVAKPGDDPNDRDQGTGNDGHHDDHGGGNDGREGSKH